MISRSRTLLRILILGASVLLAFSSIRVLGEGEPLPVVTLTPLLSSTPTVIPSPPPTATPLPSPTPTQPDPVLAGAGDVSICGQEGDDQTARLLARLPGTIFVAGDGSNELASVEEYQHCFGSSWGQLLDRIRPVPGNHDYLTPGAAGYFEYFGPAAGQPGQGYYSYDLGTWHIVALDSNCSDVDCSADSPEVQWLRADLAAHPTQCTLAYWHHSYYSSGLAGSSTWLKAFFQALYDYGAEVVIGGHDHDYERFSPQDPQGKADPLQGIRQFVVGTGGVSQRGFLSILPNSEAHHSGAYGILKLTLHPDRYDWEFLPVEGQTFRDSGSTSCH